MPVILYFVQTAMLQLGSTSVLLSWLQLFNFDPAFFTSSKAGGDGKDNPCMVHLTAEQQVLASILTPVLFTVELVGFALLHRAWIAVRCSSSRSAANGGSGSNNNDSDNTHLHPQLEGQELDEQIVDVPKPPRRRLLAVARSLRALGVWTNAFQLDRYIGAWMAILLFCYTQVSSTCLQFLWCVDVNEERVVYSMPAISCRSSAYAQTLPVVLLMLAVYVIGFPIFVLAMGWRLHRQRVLTDQQKSHLQQQPEQSYQPSSSPRRSFARNDSWVAAHVASDEENHIASSSSSLASSSSSLSLSATASLNSVHVHNKPAQHPQTQEQVDRLVCSARWAPLYSQYRLEAWTWCSMVLFRRTTIALLNVVFAQSLALRSLSFALAHVVFMLLLIRVWPYGARILNLGEVGAHVALIVLSMVMTVALPPFSSKVEAMLFVLVVLPTLVLVGAILYSKLRAAAARRSSVTPLTSSSSSSSLVQIVAPPEARATVPSLPSSPSFVASSPQTAMATPEEPLVVVLVHVPFDSSPPSPPSAVAAAPSAPSATATPSRAILPPLRVARGASAPAPSSKRAHALL